MIVLHYNCTPKILLSNSDEFYIQYYQPLSPGSKSYSTMTHEVSRKKKLTEISFNKEKALNVCPLYY